MKSRFTFLAVLAALSLSFSTVFAQTDSTHYDLGRVQLHKSLTQNITIKGTNLEKFPFANLADAINVWLYGTYSSDNNRFIYVIDGNLINDVKAYNIHDIEEITLVQNAIAQINGAQSQKQLILIKTRHNHPGKSGFEAAGQTNLVTLRNSQDLYNINSTTNLFHQYYASAYQNTGNINAGISATYLRDVTPTLKSPGLIVNDPLNSNIFKFNGYADVKLGNSNTLNAAVSYAPEVNGFKYDNTINSANPQEPSSQTKTSLNQHTNQHLFNATVQLNTHIVKGLNNKLSASFNHFGYAFNQQRDITVNGAYNGPTSSITNAQDSTTQRRRSFLISDHLSYQKTLGDFTFEPAVNFSYRYTRDSVFIRDYYKSYIITPPAPPFLNSTSSSQSHLTTVRKDYLLTPSLSLSYKNSINVQGGFLTILNSKKIIGIDQDIKRIFPFISTGIDVSKLAGLKAVGVQLFGSFSQQNAFLQVDNTALTDLNYLLLNPANYDPLKVYNTYKAGAVIDISALVSINYNYERGGYQFLAYQQLSNGLIITNAIDAKFTSNRIGLNFNIIHTSTTRFISNLNATNIKQRETIFGNDLTLGNKMWTGGWVNRVDYKNIFAGLDVLYQTGKTGALNSYISLNPLIAGQNAHSFSLQNIYFGYRVKTKEFKNLEVFANGRNVWQNKKSDITDNRRFYGLGFKLGF